MSAPAWSDLETLFHEALTRAPAERAAFLAERCAGRLDLQSIASTCAAGALALLARAVEEGFFCFSTMARDPWLDTLRADPAFTKILRHAEARHREALAAFLQADGDRLLGVNVSQ